VLAVVVSRSDRASEHVGEHLLDLADWTDHEDADLPPADGGGTVYRTDGIELRHFDDLHLHLDRPARAFGTPDLLVFASRHSGGTGPLLTAHHTGNFGPAEYGGDDHALAKTAPNALSELLSAFETHAPEGYEVGMECTHHGPTDVGAPSLFAELGSDETEWDDPEGARAVARAILDLAGVAAHAPLETEKVDGNGHRRQLVGFGGGHYTPRFERIVRETDWTVGHVAADWALDAMGDAREHRDLVERAFERSGATRTVVEGDHPDIESVVDDLGYRAVSERWLRETDGVALPVAEAIEDALVPVADGLRFGAPASGVTDPDTPTTAELPSDLLAAARSVSRDRSRAAVADHAIAYVTAENGSRAVGPVAVRDDDARDVLIDALVAVLREGYDAVERTDDAVVVTGTAFDPDRARTLGVPEGPAFGRLADGEAVTVDGERIDPEAVRVERTERFPLD